MSQVVDSDVRYATFSTNGHQNFHFFPYLKIGSNNHVCYCWVLCDGNDKYSNFVSKNIENFLVSADYDYTSLKDKSKEIFPCKIIFKDAFMVCDEKCKELDSKSGTTCTMFAAIPRKKTWRIICANVGKIKCVLYASKGTQELTFCHLPIVWEEEKRIKGAGGDVTRCHFDENDNVISKVDGRINVSRAFGYFDLKDNQKLKPEEQKVICVPHTKNGIITKKDQKFVVLATDELWKVMTEDEVGKFIKHRTGKKKEEISTVCKELIGVAIKRKKGNMTVVIIQIDYKKK